MRVRPEGLMCPVSAVSLLTYQVRLAGGTETGEMHSALIVSPTEYLGQDCHFNCDKFNYTVSST